MKKMSPLILLLLLTGVASGLPFYGVETDGSGVVQRRFNFSSTLANLDPAFSNAAVKIAPIGGGAFTVKNPREYWIGTNASGIFINRSGLSVGVMDGSTYSNFDFNMKNLPSSCRVHIGAGTFYSLGDYGWGPKTGQKITGAGMDVTFLKFPANINSITNAFHNTFTMINAPVQTYSNIWLSDFTIDCNHTPGQTNTLQAIHLWNGFNTVKDVHTVGMCSFTFDPSHYQECFGLVIEESPDFHPGPKNCRGNLIDGCRVEGYTNDNFNNLTAITFGGSANGTITRNTIIQSGTNRIQGIAPGGFATVVDGNTLENVHIGLYDDSILGRTNCTIVNNNFLGCGTVIAWHNGIFRDVHIANNIAVMNSAAQGNVTAFIWLLTDQTNSGFIVTGNTVKEAANASVSPINCFMYVNNAGEMIVNSNTVDALLTNYIGSGCSHVLVHNFDPFGNLSYGNTEIPTVFLNRSSAPSFMQMGSVTNTPFFWSSNSGR